jgi:hypothetical protein
MGSDFDPRGDAALRGHVSYAAKNESFAKLVDVPPDVLKNAIVVVELPRAQSARRDAAAAFVLAANLLVRLFHRVHLVGPDVPLGPHPWKITSTRAAEGILAAMSEGEVVWGAPSGKIDVAIGIGGAPSVVASKTVVVGFASGVARIDCGVADGPEDVLAALVAACFGAAQAFLYVAAAAGAPLWPNAPFAFRLPARAPSDAIDLGTVHLAGIGAIGSALVYGLAHLACSGTVVPIDADRVDWTNLQRYVLMSAADVGLIKVDVATRVLAASSLAVMPFEGTYQQYVREHPGVRIQLAVTALDSNAGRRDVARLLPRRIVNASTTDRIITVSRHGFADGRACLFCVYADRSRAMTREQIVANELGVAAEEIERLLAENKPVDSAFVARVEAHKGVAAGTFAELINTPLASFHQRAVCGSAQISTPTGAVVAPLSFISAAAGLLLLTDLLGIVALRDEDARPNYLRMDMLGSPTFADRDIRAPDQGHACICKDVDYVDVYRARYRAA